AAAKVSPAVVTIDAVAGATTTDPFSLPSEGIGSGLIFDTNGWILTNHYVVDTLTDLAIVKVTGSSLPVGAIGDSSSLKVGQLAIAIGSPLGTYTNTV